MFELSVACKYLIPRWRQLSVSIISLVSILVIALVVWLIVVFFSVKDGLENSWVDKIIALTAPIRVSPTEKYYRSYYYQVDSLSANSDYTSKSIGEKLATSHTDPYDSAIDEELPGNWSKPLRTADGEVVDLAKQVKEAALALKTAKNTRVTDYETTMATVRFRLLRNAVDTKHQSQQFLEHASYIGSFDADSPVMAKALLPLSDADLANLLSMQSVSAENVTQDSPDTIHRVDSQELKQRLQAFFEAVSIHALKTPLHGWRLPLELVPSKATFMVAVTFKGGDIAKIFIPFEVNELPALIQRLTTDHSHVSAAKLEINDSTMQLELSGEKPQPLAPWVPLMLEEHQNLHAQVIEASIASAKKPSELHFTIDQKIQNSVLTGEISLGRFDIAEVIIHQDRATPLFATITPNRSGITLQGDPQIGDPILLPRSFREAGALAGDQGFISYSSATPSSVQEQRLPVYVAGFYDPGIMPLGSKYILAPKELTSLIRTSYDNNDVLISNGFNIRFDNLKDVASVKAELQAAFEQAGIAPYWHIETYQEFEFTKDIIQQLHSEKNLFSVISLVIIIVACSNIISMLIILVNDKKLEIGILRSMGASSASIATIFGVCGIVMGTLGSVIGILVAFLTLRYINELVALIGRLQGHDLFNPIFYGHTLPNELSFEALTFVVITTACISLLAGIVPAVKASMLRPSAILKSE